MKFTFAAILESEDGDRIILSIYEISLKFPGEGRNTSISESESKLEGLIRAGMNDTYETLWDLA
jgi:hypothetical protein